MKRTSPTALLAALFAGLLIGCQNSSPSPANPTSRHHHVVLTHVQTNGGSVTGAPAARSDQIEQAIGADPTSAGMQQISGALLEYYALHGSLPASLQELASLPDLDQPLDLVSPASGQPYAYVPGGLRSATDTREVIVYDPAADAAGLRDVILFRPPVGREAATTLVARMPDAEFGQYVR